MTGFEQARRLVSGAAHRPQCLLADAGAAALLADGIDHCARAKWLTTVYSWHPLPELEMRGFTTQRARGSFMLDLAADESAIFARFSPTKRTYIRQSEKRGLVVEEVDGPADLDALDALFIETDRRHGDPPRLRTALHALFSGQDPCRRLFVARKDGALIAATVLRYIPNGLAEYSENASQESGWQYRPNEALIWYAIRWAKLAGCRWFSFGGANAFKASFGAELRPVYRLRRDATRLRLYDRAEWMQLTLRSLARRVLRRSGPTYR